MAFMRVYGKTFPQNLSEFVNTVELQWLKHLWNHENMFKTEVVGANEC